MEKYKIVLTGANGMIGGAVAKQLLQIGHAVIGVDKTAPKISHIKYKHIQVNLSNFKDLSNALAAEVGITHIIHFAGLAHKFGEDDLSWDNYQLVNVTSSENIFKISAKMNLPILFSSTADVYGIAKGVVSKDSPRHPIGNYAKSKYLAEDALIKICASTPYTIMRFAPVYTKEIKRDIQKRYYIRYPWLAYKVGKGINYEVLDIDNLINAVYSWLGDCKVQTILNIKDSNYLNTTDVLKEEKQNGRAKIIIWIPFWLISIAYNCFKLITPYAWNTYMLNKIVNPLRSK